MKPYSMDFRERIVVACDAREGTREQIAKRFGVIDRWIRKLLKRRRETNSFAPLPRNPGHKRALNDHQMERLRRLIQKRPNATLARRLPQIFRRTRIYRNELTGTAQACIIPGFLDSRPLVKVGN